MTKDRTTRTARGKAALPAFAPVPRKCVRYDGWTPDRQRRFVEALADMGSVKSAARAVNMTPESGYNLRRQEGADGFRKAWEAALSLGVDRLEDVAMERALKGVGVPVYSYGKIVGTRRVHNDRLLMFLLRNRAPKRFAADGARGLSALDRQMLARLKKEWRAEWEAERTAAMVRDEEATFESINAKLDLMRTRHEAAQHLLLEDFAEDDGDAAEDKP